MNTKNTTQNTHRADTWADSFASTNNPERDAEYLTRLLEAYPSDADLEAATAHAKRWLGVDRLSASAVFRFGSYKENDPMSRIDREAYAKYEKVTGRSSYWAGLGYKLDLGAEPSVPLGGLGSFDRVYSKINERYPLAYWVAVEETLRSMLLPEALDMGPLGSFMDQYETDQVESDRETLRSVYDALEPIWGIRGDYVSPRILMAVAEMVIPLQFSKDPIGLVTLTRALRNVEPEEVGK